MDFSEALSKLTEGHRVSRKGWNGRGMWICYGHGHEKLEADKFWNPHTKAFAMLNGGVADVLPYIIMKTADNKIQMGWLASQADLLAQDWGVLV